MELIRQTPSYQFPIDETIPNACRKMFVDSIPLRMCVRFKYLIGWNFSWSEYLRANYEFIIWIAYEIVIVSDNVL